MANKQQGILGGIDAKSILTEDLDQLLHSYMADGGSSRVRASHGVDVGLIVVSTIGLGLMIFIAMVISILAVPI